MSGEKSSSTLDKLEQQIMAKMRQIYSERTLDHAMNPRNVGRIQSADGLAKITGPCGDTMEISLIVEKGKIRNAKFWTDGCGTAIACGSVATELARDRTAIEVSKIDSRQIFDVLGGLPESDAHCAVLAANTLRTAIQDYLNRKKTRL